MFVCVFACECIYKHILILDCIPLIKQDKSPFYYCFCFSRYSGMHRRSGGASRNWRTRLYYNKCSDRSMKVELPGLYGTHDRHTVKPSNQNRRTCGLKGKLNFDNIANRFEALNKGCMFRRRDNNYLYTKFKD